MMGIKLLFVSFLMGMVLVPSTSIAEINTTDLWVQGTSGLHTITSSPNQYFEMGGFRFYAYGVGFNLPNENVYFKVENMTNIILSTNQVNDSAVAQITYQPVSDELYVNIVQRTGLPFNVTDFDVKTRSDYNLTVTINDTFGNISRTIIRKIRFIENPEALSYITITNNASNMSSVDVISNINASFDFKFWNYTNGSMNIAKYNSSPESATIAGSALGKYVEVMLEQNLTTNMAWAIVRIHYTDWELTNKSIQNEANLKFYEFNESSGTWVEVAGSGVDVNNNFVYMNTTHFSTYGVYEETPTQSSASSSSGGGGGKNTIEQSVSGLTPYGKESEYELKKRIVRNLYDRWLNAYPSRSWGVDVDEAVFDLWFRHMEYQADKN